MKRKAKKVSRKNFLIPVILMALVTLLVILSTSYFTGNDFERQPAATPAPVIEDEPKQVPATPAPVIEDVPKEDPVSNGHEEKSDPNVDTLFDIRELDPEISKFLDYFALKHNSAAVSLVAYDGKQRDYYTYTYGYRDKEKGTAVDTDTKFCVASLSKLVTVICALTLVDEGKLDLSKDISAYLGFEVRAPGFPDTEITARMLMQHVSSIIDPDGYLSKEKRDLPQTTIDILKTNTCYSGMKPGTHFYYSGYFGYAVLALICEIISEKRFDTLARDVLFGPLGIDAAYLPNNLQDTENIAILYQHIHTDKITVQEQLNTGDERISDHERAGANLVINAVDYAKILMMLGNGGSFDDVRILSEESVRNMHKVDIHGYDFRQGLATRFLNNVAFPFPGYYYHIGGAWGALTQYIYYIHASSNHGVVIMTTGATFYRPHTPVFDICADMSYVALKILNR